MKIRFGNTPLALKKVLSAIWYFALVNIDEEKSALYQL